MGLGGSHAERARESPENDANEREAILDDDEFMEVIGRVTLEGVGAALLRRAFITRAAPFFPGETVLGFGARNGFSKVNDTLAAGLELIEGIQRELELAY